MIYADDSGAEATGWIVYGWIECSPQGWRPALRNCLDLRKALKANHCVEVDTELHATKFINGRARIADETSPNFKAWDVSAGDKPDWKILGRKVAEECLSAVATCPDLRVGSVYRRTNKTGKAFHQEKADTYKALIEMLDGHLQDEGCYGTIFMDGNGTDRSYAAAHRELKLAHRNLIEDPLFIDSTRSQLMQMADLVAYVTYLHLHKRQGAEFGWGWHDQYLKASHLYSGPMQI